VNSSAPLRSKLTKIRISAQLLAIETGRYCKPITPADQRFCKYCKHLIEDEVYFLLVCPTYKDGCKKFGIDGTENIKNLSNHQSFKGSKVLCSFIKECLDL
jgi:hypothetical protein